MRYEHSGRPIYKLRQFFHAKTSGSVALLENGDIVLHFDKFEVLNTVESPRSAKGAYVSALNSGEIVMSITELEALLEAIRDVKRTRSELPSPLLRRP